jgi:hypothetical protein
LLAYPNFLSIAMPVYINEETTRNVKIIIKIKIKKNIKSLWKSIMSLKIKVAGV